MQQGKVVVAVFAVKSLFTSDDTRFQNSFRLQTFGAFRSRHNANIIYLSKTFVQLISIVYIPFNYCNLLLIKEISDILRWLLRNCFKKNYLSFYSGHQEDI